MANEALNQAIDDILMLDDAALVKFLDSDPLQQLAALEPLHRAITESSKDKSRFPQDARARGLSMLHAALILLASKVTPAESPDEKSLAVVKKCFEHYRAFNVDPDKYLLTFVFKDLYGEIESYCRDMKLSYYPDLLKKELLKKELLKCEHDANMAYSAGRKAGKENVITIDDNNVIDVILNKNEKMTYGAPKANNASAATRQTIISFFSTDTHSLRSLDAKSISFNMPIDKKRLWRVNGFSDVYAKNHVKFLNTGFPESEPSKDPQAVRKYELGKKALDELNYLFSITNAGETFAQSVSKPDDKTLSTDAEKSNISVDNNKSSGIESQKTTARPGKMDIHPLSNWEKYPHTSVRAPLNESKNHNDAVAKSISTLSSRHRGVVLRPKLQSFSEVCDNTKVDMPLDNVFYTPHSRNPEVMASCYYVLAVEGMGVQANIAHADANGREAVFFMHLGAMVIYYDKYQVLPTFDDKITERLNFLDIMADLYADAYYKRKGSSHIDDDDLAMFPPDFVDHLHLNYPCLFEIKEPKINKTYLLGFSAFAAGLAVAGVACYGEIDRWQHLETVKDKIIGDDFLSDLDTTGGLMLSAAGVVFVAAALYNYWSQTQRVNEAMPATPTVTLRMPVESETFRISDKRSFGIRK